MGRASIPTLLPLDAYAKIMGIDPRHFNGVTTVLWPGTASCGALWYQYAWQNADAASREDLAEAIHQAEEDLAKYLGYFLAPSWVEEEVRRWTFTIPKEQRFATNIGLTPRGLRKSVETEWAKVIVGGTRALVDIAVPTGAPITWTWSDLDGDGEDDAVVIAVITFPALLTDPDEVAVYFAGHDGDEAYRIRPIEVDLSAGTITISRWLLVRPELWEIQQAEIDGLDDANFVSAVDIYWLYNDIETQARFEWEPLPSEECDEICGYWYQTACLGLRDYRLGLAVPYPAVYASGMFTKVDFQLDREPDRVRLWYESGEPLVRGEMSPYWQRAVAYYATALLQRKICGCEPTEKFIDYWREPPSLETEEWTDSVRNCPWGPRRGAVFAWQKARDNTIGRGMAV